MITSPILANHQETDEFLTKISYPVLVTPKLDGVRTLITPQGPVSRTFKPIPNKHIRAALSDLPPGLDGEIIVPGKEFKDISGAWRNAAGEPNFIYAVFDYVTTIPGWRTDLEIPYWKRMVHLRELGLSDFCEKILPVACTSAESVLEWEATFISEGYEGLMLRGVDSPYKCGRSTLKEQYLIALKRFQDAEAVIIGFEEQCKNTCEAQKDAFGHTKRAQSKDQRQPKNTLGALVCRGQGGRWDGVEFSIGTGFTDDERSHIWNNKLEYEGALINFKFQACGSDAKPRIPVYRGMRAEG